MAEAARDYHHLDRVIFIPAGEPPHKRTPQTSARHRLAMVRLAARGNAAFAVSDWEIQQKRVVFTVETLQHFHGVWPKAMLRFIIGSDSLRDIPKWREGTRLLKRWSFSVIERPEVPWTSISPALRRAVDKVPCPMVPFASHEIRAAVHRGRSIRYQVPEPVERYVHLRRLYRRPE